jgi:hypothetical protein
MEKTINFFPCFRSVIVFINENFELYVYKTKMLNMVFVKQKASKTFSLVLAIINTISDTNIFVEWE